MRTTTTRPAGLLPPVTDEPVVPWAELARHCGAPSGWHGGEGVILPEVAAWAEANNVTLRRHWLGGPGLSVSDAAKVREALVQAAAEETAGRAAYHQFAAHLRDEAAMQLKAHVDGARDDAVKKARRRGVVNLNDLEDIARRAEEEARESFRRVYLPSYEEWKADQPRTKRPAGTGARS